MTITYADDRATIHNGEALAVLASLPTASCDGLITDPPYSSGGMVRGDRADGVHSKYVRNDSASGQELVGFSGDTRDGRSYGYWAALWLNECRRIVRPGGPLVVFTDWRQLPSTTDAVQAGGWVWRGIVPWVKPASRPQSGRFSAAAEFVVWGSNGPMPIDHADPALPGFYEGAEQVPGCPCCQPEQHPQLPPFYRASSPRARDHITQKPLDVMRGLVRIVPPGGVVLDPFCGAGTTGAAAMIEGRRFVGVEEIEHHAETTARRVRESQGQAVERTDQASLDLFA